MSINRFDDYSTKVRRMFDIAGKDVLNEQEVLELAELTTEIEEYESKMMTELKNLKDLLL